MPNLVSNKFEKNFIILAKYDLKGSEIDREVLKPNKKQI